MTTSYRAIARGTTGVAIEANGAPRPGVFVNSARLFGQLTARRQRTIIDQPS